MIKTPPSHPKAFAQMGMLGYFNMRIIQYPKLCVHRWGGTLLATCYLLNQIEPIELPYLSKALLHLQLT
jgi:hypothetical protein